MVYAGVAVVGILWVAPLVGILAGLFTKGAQ